MSHQYQPTSYYNWPARKHGIFLDSGSYVYVPYDYYSGDEIHQQNVVFRDSQYVTFDNTHLRFLNRSDLHLYDTSGIVIHDSGTLVMYTSASPFARKFVVDEIGRVGIGMDHGQPHANRGENPSFDLDVRGQVGVEDYIYHNDDVDTYMLFGSDLSAHYVNTVGEIHDIYPDDQDEINFRVGGIDILQMQTRDVSHLESGTKPTGVQDHLTINKYQSDVDVVIRSVNEPNMLFVDSKNNRISIGDSEDAPQATLEVTNDPDSGAFDVPLVQLNNEDTDKQLLDINAKNIDADVISVSADDLVSADVVSVTADSLTTGDVFNATADGLTTGSLIHMTHTGSDKSEVSLVHFESKGDRGHDSNQTVLLDLNFDTTDGTGARALRIDSEQTTGTIFEIDVTPLTTGKGLHVHTNSRTTGELLHLYDASTVDATGSMVRLVQDGDRSGNLFSRVVDINMDTTNNPNSRTIYIDTEQRDGTVIEVDASPLTTGKGLHMHMDSRTTGTGLHIHDAGTADSEGALVKIEQTGDRDGSQASIGLDINFDTTANPAARALRIDSEQTTGDIVEIDGYKLTTGTVLDISGVDNLSTGTIANLHSNSGNTGNRDLVKIMNDNTAATGARLLHIKNDAIASGSKESIRFESTAADKNPLLELRNSNSALDTPPVLNFKNLNYAGGSADVDLGTIKFEGQKASTSARVVYAALSARATDIETNNFGGVLNFMVQATDSPSQLRNMLSIGGQTNTSQTPDTQAEVVINEDQIDLDFRVESNTTNNAFIVYGDGKEVVVNENGASDTDFRVESDDETHMLFVDTSVNRISIGDSEDTPAATLEVTNDPSKGAYNVPLVQLNNEDTDKQLLDINAKNINADVINVHADDLTTGDVFNATADSLTTGSLIHMTHTGDSNASTSLVHFESTGDRGHDSNQTVLLDLNFDTTAGTGARAFRVDSEQTTGTVVEIDAQRVTTGTAMTVSAADMTTGTGLEIGFASRTTGTGVHIIDTHNSDSAGSLVKIEQDGNRTGTQVSIGLDINFDTTGNPNARAFKIDSEQRDGIVAEIDASMLTTGSGLSLHTDNRTSGTLLAVEDSGTNDTAGSLVKIKQSGDRDGTAASVGLDINFDTTANANARAFRIDSEQTTGVVAEIDANKITTGTAVFVDADALTTGTILNMDSNSTSSSTRSLVKITNDHTSATGTTLLHMRNDAKASGGQKAVALIESTAAETSPLLELRNSNTATNTPPILNFLRSGNDEENDMCLGTVTFEGKDSGNTETVYAAISARATDKDNIREAGEVSILVQAYDNSMSTLKNLLRIGKQESTSTSVTTKAEVVVNEDSMPCDFRVESTTNTNAFTVYGDGTEVVVNDQGRNDTDFRVESNKGISFTADTHPGQLTYSKTHALFVNTATGGVGLGTASPAATLHVVGDTHIEGDLWIKGETNQLDTLVYVTSAMDIVNNGTGPALTVTQNGAQPVAAFYDGNTTGATKWPALFIENGDQSGPGNVGIGTSNPEYDLEVLKTGRNDQDTVLAVTTHSTGAHESVLRLQRSKGTEASPLEVADNDILGTIMFCGMNKTNAGTTVWNEGASIMARVDGTPSENKNEDMPGELVFSTTKDDAEGATERMNIKPTGTVNILNNNDGHTGLLIDNNHTTGNGVRKALSIDMDISGADTATGDRGHIGLDIDVDSSYTGGNTTNEGILYGIKSTTTSSGDNNRVYGAYILGQTAGTDSKVETTTDSLYGAYIQADNDRSTKNTNQYGVYALSQMDNSGATATTAVTNSYGVLGLHKNNTGGTTGTTTAAHGGHFEVECGEGTITTAYGVASVIDKATTGTITNSYQFHGDSSLTSDTYGPARETGGSHWGVYSANAGRHALQGHLHLGDRDSSSGTGLTKTLTPVTMYVQATDGIRIPAGTTEQRPLSSVFHGTSNKALPLMHGTIRYNTENKTFEGFGAGDQWGSLGGVIDTDRDTYWTAVNDLNNLHDPGKTSDVSGEYGTDEFADTDYPGDVDYLRAFTKGLKRFAISDTGDSRWYHKSSGAGTAGDPYVYSNMLQIAIASDGATISSQNEKSKVHITTLDLPSDYGGANANTQHRAGEIVLLTGKATDRTQLGNGSHGGHVSITTGDGGNSASILPRTGIGGDAGDISITAGTGGEGYPSPANDGKDGSIILTSSNQVKVQNSGLSVYGANKYTNSNGAHLGYDNGYANLELKGTTGGHIDFCHTTQDYSSRIQHTAAGLELMVHQRSNAGEQMRFSTGGIKRLAIEDSGEVHFFHTASSKSLTVNPHSTGVDLNTPVEAKNFKIETTNVASSSTAQAGDITLQTGKATNRTTNGNGGVGGDIYLTAGDGAKAGILGFAANGGRGGNITIETGKGGGKSGSGTDGADGIVTIKTDSKVSFQNTSNTETASIDTDGSADFTSMTLDNALPVTEGGTGATTAATAATALGLGTSNNVQHNSLGIGKAATGTAGEIVATNDITAFSTSDKRLKQNITNIDTALDKVTKLNGVEFDWRPLSEDERNTIHSHTGHDVGVIAQEVEQVLPEAVQTRQNGYKAVDHDKIVPLLIEAIKEQQSQIDQLKQQVERLQQL